MFELDITFSEAEKKLLTEYSDVDIKLTVRSDALFYTGEEYRVAIENPRRMIGVGGLYLLEVEDEPNEWHMGQFEKDFTYIFWGSYGDLENALKSL